MNSLKDLYDADYYERGEQSGKSCYTNYRWMPKKTIEMISCICKYAEIQKNHCVLDFGCAKGFSVQALSLLGYSAEGCDISDYAVSNCHPAAADKLFIYNGSFPKKYDVIVAKDVLEHVPYEDLEDLIKKFRLNTKKLFVIVPLGDGSKYNVPEYELDITHIIRESKEWWENIFIKNGFSVTKSDFLVPGIKDNWSHYPIGNGFLVLE